MGVVDEIKGRLDIVDFIAGYVPSLTKAGKTCKGLCPFHAEKTPSFIVFPETQTWHCFGACGAGGDIFSFIMRQEGYQFSEALRFLADKAGVLLAERSADDAEADKRRQKLLEIVSLAASFFHSRLLQSPQAEFARNYVARRGLGAETVQTFQLGYAPNRWDGLKTHLLQKGYAEADLAAAGVLIAREDKSSGYDRFRDRFIVPIRNERGQTIGFGARALRDEQTPKYLNSPQNALFDKSAALFGLDIAKNAIRESGQAVIVEGYMDALQAYEQGYKNVVAEMGTALTDPQLKLLKRYAGRFVLALDADSAGSAATLRGINTARQALTEGVKAVPTAQGGFRYEGRLDADLRIVSLPPGRDPDDFLRESPEAWAALVEQALPLVDYYIQTVTASLNLEVAKDKAKAVATLMPVLREIPNSVEQEHYLQQLARLVTIDERVLRAELERAAQKTARPADRYSARPAETKPQSAAKTTGGLEEYCLAMLLGRPGTLNSVNKKLVAQNIDVLNTEDFADVQNGALFLAVKHWAVTPNATTDPPLQTTDPHLEGRLAGVLALWHNRPAPLEYVERELPKLVLRMRRNRLEKQIRELNQMQRDSLQTNDRDGALQCRRLISEAKDNLNILDKAHDALSITGRRRMEETFRG